MRWFGTSEEGASVMHTVRGFMRWMIGLAPGAPRVAGMLVLLSCAEPATTTEAGVLDARLGLVDAEVAELDAELRDTGLRLGEACRTGFECESGFCYFPRSGCGMGVCSRCVPDSAVLGGEGGPPQEYVCTCGGQTVNAYCVSEPWVSRGRCDAGGAD